MDIQWYIGTVPRQHHHCYETNTRVQGIFPVC